MSPIEDELRTALHTKADPLPPVAEPLAGIERTARTLRRRRIAAATLGAAAVVAGVVTLGPAALPGTLASRHGQPAGAGHHGDGGRPASAVDAPAYLSGHGWPMDDDASLRARYGRTATATFENWLRYVEYAPTGATRVLWAGHDGDGKVVLAVGAGSYIRPGGAFVALWVPGGHEGGLDDIHDVAPGATDMTFREELYSDPDPRHLGWVLVLDSPGATKVEYRLPGHTWRASGSLQRLRTGDGFAMFRRLTTRALGENPRDEVRVRDGSGEVRYRGRVGDGPRNHPLD
jgi:hypothetical protein